MRFLKTAHRRKESGCMNIEDSLYTGIYLYGTDNHLSTEGAQIRTEKVIRDLKEQFVKEEKK